MSNAARAPQPVEVQRVVEEKLVRIAWSDGHQSEYPFPYLRGWCPCAQCQGHGSELRFIETPHADLTRITVVGRYALNLIWADGHDTGLYTYRYLRGLCPCEVCRPRG